MAFWNKEAKSATYQSEPLKNVEEMRQAAYDFSLPYHAIWWVCLLRACDQHYSELDPTTWRFSNFRMKDPQFPRNKMPKISKTLDDIVKANSKTFPVPIVREGSGDYSEDLRSAAQVGDQWMHYKYRALREKQSIKKNWYWTCVTGNYFEQAQLYVKDYEQKQREGPGEIEVGGGAMECQRCGEIFMPGLQSCPACGASGTENVFNSDASYKKRVDKMPMTENGKPVMDEIPLYGIKRRDILPFAMYPFANSRDGLASAQGWYYFTVESAEAMSKIVGKDLSKGAFKNPEYPYCYQGMLNQIVPDIYGKSLVGMGLAGNMDLIHDDYVVLWHRFRRP